MKHAIILSCVISVVIGGTAGADPHHVLVLRADGNADAATRTKVDAQVLKLAKSIEGNVEAGEISFTDAATAVGCSGNEAQCRDDVLSTMGVDEVVSINVTAMPSGDTRILVHRIPKGSPIRDAQTTVPSGQPVDAKIAADIGPIFGVFAAAPPPSTKPTPPLTPTTPPAKPVPPPPPPPPSSGTTGSGSAPLPPFGDPTHAPAPTRTAQADSTNNVTAAPNGQVTTPEGHSNRPVVGMAIGGGMVLLAIIMWGEAASTQNDINAAPTRSPTDFRNLQDLESTGDTYATLGNLFFVGGIAVAGVSGYFFWKDRRSHSSSQARLAPTMFDHGAGIALTFGGAP